MTNRTRPVQNKKKSANPDHGIELLDHKPIMGIYWINKFMQMLSIKLLENFLENIDKKVTYKLWNINETFTFFSAVQTFHLWEKKIINNNNNNK